MLHIGSEHTLAIAATRRPSLYAVLEGTLTLCVTNSREVTLHAGEIGIVFYGDAHRIGSGPSVSRLITPPTARRMADTFEHCRFDGGEEQAIVMQCILDLAYFGAGAMSSRAAPDLMLMLDPERRTIESALPLFPFQPEALMRGLDLPGGEAIAFAFANMQLCYALKQYSNIVWGTNFREARNPNVRRICTIIREVRSHPERDWTVDSMAIYVGMSRSAFAFAFHDYVDEAPISFLKRQRMERAAKLLLKDSLSMHDVGRRVGYDIESSFARAFKRHWGVPPRAFVRNYRQHAIRTH